MRRTNVGTPRLRVRCTDIELDMLSHADLTRLLFIARSCHDVDTSMTNLGVHTLGDVQLSFEERVVLAKGMRFVPTPSRSSLPLQRTMFISSVRAFHRRLRLRHYFGSDPPNRVALSFRVPKPNWQPPEEDRVMLAAIRQASLAISDKVDEAVHRLRVVYPRSNLTKSDKDAIATLRSKDIVVRPADKNLGVTAMSLSWYNAEVERQMANTNTYERVSPDVQFKHLVAGLRQRLLSLIDRQGRFKHTAAAISPNLPRFLLQHATHKTARLPRFYCIPKLHKNPPKGRPIVASLQWVTTPASKALDKLLQPLVSHVAPRVLQDTTQLIRTLEATVVPNDAILFTADVESLYTSIPHDACSQAIVHWLNVAQSTNRLHHLPWWRPDMDMVHVKALIDALVRFVLNNNYFTTGNDDAGHPRRFLQRTGMAMGTQFAPVGANLFMAWVEDVHYHVEHHKQDNLLMWFRYIDDVFGIWTGSEDQLSVFFDTIGASYTAIRLTHEVHTHSIDFMDLTISKGHRFATHGILDLRVHRKRLNRYLYLPWTSAHPRSMKAAFLKAELIRFIRNSSSFQAFLKDVSFFAAALRARGYPPAFLKAVFKTVEYRNRSKHLAPKTASTHPSSQDTPPDTPLTFVHQHSPLAIAAGVRDVLTLTHSKLSEVGDTSPGQLDTVIATRPRWMGAKKLPDRLQSLLSKSWPPCFD